jgi:hypothetical protein
MLCQFFIEYYMAKCTALKIEPEEKYIEAEKRIKARDNKSTQRPTNTTGVNRKLASHMHLNKKLYGDSEGNYTRICNEIVDDSIMQEKNAVKDLGEDLELD